MSDVLAFPQRHKGRIRRSRGMDAAGMLSLLLLDREREPIPANVERFDGLDSEGMPPRSPELLLALLLLSALPAKRKESIKSAVRAMAFGNHADPTTMQLHRLLSFERD